MPDVTIRATRCIIIYPARCFFTFNHIVTCGYTMIYNIFVLEYYLRSAAFNGNAEPTMTHYIAKLPTRFDLHSHSHSCLTRVVRTVSVLGEPTSIWESARTSKQYTHLAAVVFSICGISEFTTAWIPYFLIARGLEEITSVSEVPRGLRGMAASEVIGRGGLRPESKM